MTLADSPISSRSDADALVDEAVELVEQWLGDAEALETRRSQQTIERLRGIVVDDAGVDFVMAFIDRVARPDDPAVAARQLHSLVRQTGRLPAFLGPVDRLLLRAGAAVGRLLPRIVVPLARRRMRGIVGHLVAPTRPDRLADHLAGQHDAGWASNVNLLGEAVLGDREAERRHAALRGLIELPDVDYVSVKLSSVASQLNPWAYDAAVDATADRLAELIDAAAAQVPATFVNVDMEEYHDLELTLDAFERVLGDPARRSLDAGIVLQAYLPDALGALERLSAWAGDRQRDGGGRITVRLVKGANLAMERVDAAIHGWEQAPYGSKAETDANYVRCLDWVLTPEHMAGMRIGVASHNLFHVAWALLLADRRGVADRVRFEMLQGMAEAHAAAVAATASSEPRPLLYTPAVDPSDFDVAVGYLFRRLEETAAEDNFLRALFDLTAGSATFAAEAARFTASVSDRALPSTAPRRDQDRARPDRPPFSPGEPFRNEPETDPTTAANRRWLADVVETPPRTRLPDPIVDPGDIDRIVERVREAQVGWWALAPVERRSALHRVADQLGHRRVELMRTMADECGKTLAEADIEISEAIDFARYYGERAVELDRPGLRFEPFGVVSVVPPWNFPVAIPAGGVLAALAAGNGVVFKPAPEAVRCASIVADAVHAAGVPTDLVVLTPTGDDAAGRAVVEHGDAVILTGSSETADLFRSWNPRIRLFAETSGKNALVVTPHADIDLAVQDLVRSAFGHAGQKCSAASLAILVGSVADSERFHRQLIDAVNTLTVRPPDDPEALVGPLIGPPNPRLQRAFTVLDAGESWLVEPQLLDADRNLWRPGVRTGVVPGSWYHRTECFGPVLGLMRADDLDDAIRIQNDSDFGLTGGIHTLDPDEITRWRDAVEVGNAYVNRPITGAIVQRQPFGGWKRSTVGPGAKAGGPNYVAQLGTWRTDDTAALFPDDASIWSDHFAREHDPSDLFCETNVFRYRPLRRVALRIGAGADHRDIARVRRAARTVGVELVESDAAAEPEADFAERLAALNVERVRVVGAPPDDELPAAAGAIGVHVATAPVVEDGRIELLHFVREQSVSATIHRFGNVPRWSARDRSLT